MRQTLYLAWRYLVYHRFKTAILVTAITLIFYLPGGLRVKCGTPDVGANPENARSRNPSPEEIRPATATCQSDPPDLNQE